MLCVQRSHDEFARLTLDKSRLVTSEQLIEFFQPGFWNDVKLNFQLQLLEFLVVETRHIFCLRVDFRTDCASLIGFLHFPIVLFSYG